MNFLEAEKKYQSLLQRKRTEELSEEEFISAVQKLRIQSPDGTWWQMRPSDGVWMHWDGSTWVENQAGAVQQTGQRKKRSPFVTFLLVFSILACVGVFLLAAVGVGGYFLISSGILSRREIFNAVGLGTGELSIVNIADETLAVELIRLDTESGSPETVNNEIILPFDISGFGGIQPGKYELHISSPSGKPPGGICRLSIASGDAYQFVAVPEGIAVSLEGEAVQNPDDVDILTSRLCR